VLNKYIPPGALASLGLWVEWAGLSYTRRASVGGLTTTKGVPAAALGVFAKP
jgi:hypothetical protein